jgi:hypothetical protein
MVKSLENPTTHEGLHEFGNPTKIEVYMGKSWENPTTKKGLRGNSWETQQK